MDLDTAATASLLPLSRLRVASSFKAHWSRASIIRAVLDDCEVPAAQASALASAARDEGRAALVRAARAGIEPIPLGDTRYPALLGSIPDPPPVLWVKGETVSLGQPSVAIVGSRAASEYARQVGERLSSELASRGIVVISGLARGVDSAGHQGCLDAGGVTVAVLGSGPDRIYPAEHRTLAGRVATRGALVSELAPGTPPRPEHFPLRNRIISGISLAVVVVEASESSGSLITARCALDQGREVMAVPGSVLTGRNAGSHRLLKDGAKVVEDVDDILEELGWPRADVPFRGAGAPDSDPVLRRMQDGEVYRLDELMALTGLAGSKLLPRLMELELQGRLTTTPAGGFTRTARR